MMKTNARSSRLSLLVSLFWRVFPVVLSFTLIYSVQAVQAGTASWKRPVEIYKTNRDIDIAILLNDKSGRVHVFWSEREFRLDGTVASSTIYYMTREGDVWIGPFDVIHVKNISIFDLKGIIDDYGRAHLVYKGDLAELTYVRSKDALITNAQNWIVPIELSNPSQLNVEIVQDTEQKLHLISTEVESPVGEWVPSGLEDQWRGPSDLAFPPQLNQGIDQPLLAFDASGIMHLVWTPIPLPDAYPPLGSYYSRSEDGGETWSTPFELAPPDHMVMDLVIKDQDELHVIFVGRAGVEGRYHRMSGDKGLTWSEAQPLMEGGGGLSGGDLALDSANILHTVFGSGRGGAVAHTSWDGSQWSELDDISQGWGEDNEKMEIVVTNGNHLHVIWRDNQTDGETGIWYVEGISDAPEVPVAEFLPVPVESQKTPTIPETGSNESAQTSLLLPPASNAIPGDQPSTIQSVGMPLSVGAMVSMLIIGGYIAYQFVKRNARI